ncbi:MAG: DegT/DnrJ/EryC1/StrS family aminotransferase [Chromatiaceae bacterium]|nr:DegT/DnrJ/EryC1/StrS family aminotransferase [Chromatiaceae bacterium]MCF7996332.1 DegT/DnrJ/EryC1/StrS family aminotransferase [Chromatiaceae bacterium]MCF8016849.1 DegT/DnrJ/EryC1/StrS family aminotransferase [Chromatiaceae bacterium]
MDLLLDVNVAIDSCIGRKPWCDTVDLALAKCLHEGGQRWLYAGSIQTLEYVCRRELRRSRPGEEPPMTNEQAALRAKELLHAFSADKQWLAALSNEASVFTAPDPEDEQLIRALDQFPRGTIRLLTRDEPLMQRYPDRTLSPEAYCAQAASPAPITFVDLKPQQDAIRPALEQQLHRVLHHGQYILGPEVTELEQQLATFTGAQHCISVASGTEALLISLMALDIGPGDEVITSPFTFVATVEVIVLLGATPIFVDIEPDTANIDASLIEAKLSERTKAILPVSLYGQPADMDAINAIAARHGQLPVIEDAAQSFGASYQGKRSGSLSTLGCTSFFPSKPLGCYGDGGAIFTSDDRLAQACREIRVHGQSARYVHSRIGVGGRMDTLQAAIVLAKLPRFEHEIAQRQAVARRYHALFATEEHGNHGQNQPTPSVSVRVLPWPKQDRTSVFAQYTLRVQDRDRLQAKLKEQGIPTAVHYPVPLNEQPAYRHLCCPDCTLVAQQLAREVMSLPMHADLSAVDQQRIVTALKASGV